MLFMSHLFMLLLYYRLFCAHGADRGLVRDRQLRPLDGPFQAGHLDGDDGGLLCQGRTGDLLFHASLVGSQLEMGADRSSQLDVDVPGYHAGTRHRLSDEQIHRRALESCCASGF